MKSLQEYLIQDENQRFVNESIDALLNLLGTSKLKSYALKIIEQLYSEGGKLYQILNKYPEMSKYINKSILFDSILTVNKKNRFDLKKSKLLAGIPEKDRDKFLDSIENITGSIDKLVKEFGGPLIEYVMKVLKMKFGLK